jgi:hypothetical protein
MGAYGNDEIDTPCKASYSRTATQPRLADW